MTLAVGSPAPAVPRVTLEGPHALIFYKVTCPTCRIAAPALDGLERAYPGRVRGVGQDPPDTLELFSAEVGISFPSVPDTEPYDASNAYGIRHVPTLVVVDGSRHVADVVESWDRDGTNRVSATLAALLGVDPAIVSDPSDGLPEFRPG